MAPSSQELEPPGKPGRFISQSALELRGVVGCTNSHYLAAKTSCCGGFCVEDEELHDLYVDPTNLAVKLQLYDQVACCPFCHSARWDIEPADVRDVPDRWRWAIEPASDAPGA